jgi:hypothetical protein
VFIHLFVGEIDLGAGGDDQRELHLFRARAPRLKKDAVHAGENQLAHRAPVCGGLCFQPAVERRGDIDSSANAILLHKGYYPMCAINMERKMMCRYDLLYPYQACNEIGAGKIQIKT